MNYRNYIPVVVLGLVGLFLLRGCFSGPEGQIRKQLAELEELSSFDSGEGDLTAITSAKRLGNLFTEDVQVEFRGSGSRVRYISGRTQITQAAIAARKQLAGLEVSLYDITVEVADDKYTALVEATGRAKVTGEGRSDVQDFVFVFHQTDKGWLIAEVRTV